MIRIHNPALLRILSIIVGFSVIYNILALFHDFKGMEYFSLTILPLLFLISINILDKKNTFWLLIPLSLYFVDRFIVYINYGISNILEGAISSNNYPIYGYFLQTNGLRFILSLLITILLISFITSAQKQWFYKIRKLVTFLVFLQALEYGLYLNNEFGKSSISIIEMIIVIPNYFYFVIFASFMTRIHLFEIYSEMGSLEDINRRSPEAVRKAQLKHLTQAVQSPKPMSNPGPIKSSPQYHGSSPQRPYQPPKTKPTYQPPIQTHNARSVQTCPQCGEVNQSPPMCRKCGEALR